MANILNERRTKTSDQIQQLRAQLTEAETLCRGKACVYATGSYGRGEANQHSDLDLFIVGHPSTDDGRHLTALNEICIKADLIEATRSFGIQDFSGDGQYLDHYTIHQLVSSLGTPEDDAENTFTARLLLLLESHPVLEQSVYKSAIDNVLAAYWRDYEGHKTDFMPAYLANDILRLWRTFCVNYEARTSTEPELQKAKRRLKNYKLKHSRLLTCYSALLQLLCVYGERRTVSPLDAAHMVSLSPTERLEWLLKQTSVSGAHENIQTLVDRYEKFLEISATPEDELHRQFLDRQKYRNFISAADSFGDLMFEVLDTVGARNRFHRLIVV